MYRAVQPTHTQHSVRENVVGRTTTDLGWDFKIAISLGNSMPLSLTTLKYVTYQYSHQQNSSATENVNSSDFFSNTRLRVGEHLAVINVTQ